MLDELVVEAFQVGERDRPPRFPVPGLGVEVALRLRVPEQMCKIVWVSGMTEAMGHLPGMSWKGVCSLGRLTVSPSCPMPGMWAT